MAQYFTLLGRRVEVLYRAGDILLPATGTLVADSGRSIFLEEHFSQHGKEKTFRWEIPYQSIVGLEDRPASPAPSASASPEGPDAAAAPLGVLPLKSRPGEA